MNGMTPDPMTGMAPNITKWEAAKRGVAALLHDCETAYAAAEAYVVGGVETFRSAGGGNTFTQIFPGANFGVIKNGGAISQSNFEANIAAQSPAGGTPLAGALTDTDINLVRAPFVNLPAGEQRYLSILTDGMATAPPPLSSLGTPAFPDTVIFAMGFGIGGGWDGVDYATIADLATKGKTAPLGVSQVYHGENAGAIDKFYTNSIAASLGYTPSVDPVFDLYPGEHVHFRFDVTGAEEAYMITAQGFDFLDGNWDFCLMAPSGMHCADTRMEGNMEVRAGSGHSHGSPTETLAPFLVTMKQHQGRCTIFLNRNGADTHDWVGRWHFMAYYKADPAEPLMVMPSLSDFVLPAGAPPVRGALYSRFSQKPTERLPVRAIAGRPAHQLATGLNGISTNSPEPPCAVSINIFKRTSRRASLTATAKAPFAGEDIILTLQLSDASGGRQDVHTLVARLVAPNHALGNAVADLKTVPVKARRQFINRENTEDPFDLLQYLAEYERLKPGAFAIRDEEIEFKQKDDNTWIARIKRNAFPGVYRIALYVEGIYYSKGEKPENDRKKGKEGGGHSHRCCELGPQRFTESLHTEIALGIKPDEKQSRAELHWTDPNKFVVSATLIDASGNIALPTAGHVPVVTVGGKAIHAKTLSSLTAEYLMEVTLIGRNIEIAPGGQTVKSGDVVVEAVDGERVPIKQNANLSVGVEISGNKLKVDIPELIGDRETRKVFPAGTQEAMKIAMENRQSFASTQEARDSGFQL